jgi:membrane-bound transcription factor site-1 protease
MGYHIDVLGEPYTCFDAADYGILMIVDPEEEFFPEEIKKIYTDVTVDGLSLVVISDWYHHDLLLKLRFFDENTRQWWIPATGGANVPALNDLLQSFGISFGTAVYDGEVLLNSKPLQFNSGNAIRTFPQGGRVLPLKLHDQSAQLLGQGDSLHSVPVLGLLPDVGQGRIAIYGDSNLVDSAHQRRSAWWLVKSIMQFASQGTVTNDLKALLLQINDPYHSGEPLPVRLDSAAATLQLFSKVIDQPLPTCQQFEWLQSLPPPDAQPYRFPEPRYFVPQPPSLTRPPETPTIASSLSATHVLIVAALIFCFFILFRMRSKPQPGWSSPDRPEP